MTEPFEAMLAEYASLRSEISHRVNNQLLILGVNVALVAAAIPAFSALKTMADSLLLFIVPLPLCIAGVFYFDQDVLISHVASYVEHRLRPALRRELRRARPGENIDAVLDWETYRRGLLFGPQSDKLVLRSVAAFRVIAGCGPTFGACVWAPWHYHWAAADAAHRALAVVICLFDVGALGLLLALAGRVPSLYRRGPRRQGGGGHPAQASATAPRQP